MAPSSPVTAADYTVVIPAFNASATLAHALDSVMAQTLPAREVVVVDDGSPDRTEIARIVAGYGGRVVLLQQENAGPAAARNAGVRASGGAWIAFLDADDSWLPHKMQAQLALAGDEDVGLLHGAARLDRLMLPEEMDFDLLWRANRICTSMTVVRRSVFERLGGFFEAPELIGAEDYNLWLRIAHAGWRVRACEGLVGHYTPAEGSLTSRIERCALAEIRNARELGESLGLPRRDIRWKLRAIRTDFARHLIHARCPSPARRLLVRALFERPTLERIGLMSVSYVPTPLLDMRRRLRKRGRQTLYGF
ncbi:glycosyltransferase family A protein [Pseudoxanthomonas sp. YR558]|uniref:glycosyltransferase family 2 protein n=1 Tax=Pseudoxanthomonas sp. YR558 TaxID=1881044 RepID=UPI0008EEDDBB|nr:glycosyltransferase family A protein [Pseudoxanthomonas sp. YR558]PPJ43723.1 glycosyltransferase family 2 protein [Pseudoxanthomonas sp. KAs_5_3]SFV36143.1 Glycosyl transferase family 2 [Pseudoxanthomonas sp. YR558]